MKLWLPLLLLLSLAYASPIKLKNTPESAIYQACASAAKDAGFRSYSACSYPPYAGTIALCIQNHAEGSVFEKTVALFNATCKGSISSFENLYSNASEHATDSIGLNMASPVVIPTSIFTPWREAYYSYNQNYDYLRYCGYAVMCFWGLVMVGFALHNLALKTGLLMHFYGGFARLFRLKVSLPSMIRKTHKQPIKLVGGYIPARLEALIIMLYLVVLIVVFSVNWPHIKNLPASYSNLYTSMFAVRTSIVGLSHLPFIFLFGGRNNILATVTGISFENFLHFHRVTGCMMVVCFIAHGACYSAMSIQRGTYDLLMNKRIMIEGTFSLVAVSLMLLFSLYWLRKRAYEVFLFIHILLAATFIGGAWKHSTGPGFQNYVYAAAAVWVFERTIRLIRMFRFGIAKAEYQEMSLEVMRVTVSKPKRWDFKPGQHCFVYFCLSHGLLLSHPFTVTESSTRPGKVSFYIKKKKGITKKLFEAVQNGKSPRVLVEGPYGTHNAASKYDNSVFVAGGNGILSAYQHISKVMKQDLVENGRPIHLIWINKNKDSLKWFIQELKTICAPNVHLDIYLTREAWKEDPRSSASTPTIDDSNEKFGEVKGKLEAETCTKSLDSDLDTDCEDDILGMPRVNVFYRKPDLKRVIQESSEGSNGLVAVVSCGPGGMSDEVRSNVADAVADYKSGRVEYFEELQSW